MKRLFTAFAAAAGLLLAFHADLSIAQNKDDGGKNVTRVDLPQKWALLIGVNDYLNVNKLKYCSADIRELANRLIKAGFSADHIILLHDEAADLKYKPIKSNVELQLKLLARQAKAEDLVFVAFSGHGVVLKNETGDGVGVGYLCPIDADLEEPASTLVPLDKVYKTLESCPAKQKVLLVDACRDVPTLPGGKGPVDPVAANDAFAAALSEKKPVGGIVQLNSCKREQQSWEDAELGHGVFMHFFMEGLSGKAPHSGDYIGIYDLFNYAADKTTVFVSKNKSKIQTPVIGQASEIGNFEFVKAVSFEPIAGPATPGSVGANRPEAEEPLSPMAEIQIGQGDRYYSNGEYDEAIHTFDAAINLNPRHRSLYIKRGAAYLAKGNIKMVISDYQAGNSMLSLPVTAPSSVLKIGDKQIATLKAGQILAVKGIERGVGDIDWLDVVAVDGNNAVKGYIQMTDVVKKDKPPAEPATAAQQPAQPSSQYYQQGYSNQGGYDDDERTGDHPLLESDYDAKSRAADKAWDRADRLGTPGAQKAAEAKERAAERSRDKLDRARGGR